MTFNDAEGNPCSEQSVLVYSKNIRDTFEQVVKGRGIRDPHTNLGIDGGQGKVVVTLHVHDRANTDEDDRDDKKPGCCSPLHITFTSEVNPEVATNFPLGDTWQQ